MSGPYWDQAWNPVRGCTPISPGCSHCWAQAMHERFRSEPFGQVTCLPEVLSKPLHWRKPRTVFIDCADLFHKDVPDEFIAAVFGVMAACPQHTFLVLTKRADRMAGWFKYAEKRGEQGKSLFPDDGDAWRIRQWCHVAARRSGVDMNADARQNHGGPWPLPNVWLGVTAENQAMADERIPLLLATPAAHRWVSIEPALSLVQHAGLADVDQVVWGAESGHGAREALPYWADNLLKYLTNAATSVFIKQIHMGGKLVTDPEKFPPGLRVRDLAWKPTAKGET